MDDLRAFPKPYWLEDARRMRAEGLTFKQIGAAVGRSSVTVCNALNGVKKKSYYVPVAKGGSKQKPSQFDPVRYQLRAAARDESRRTGEPVEDIYARLGVTAIDRSRAYDQRRAST